MKEAYPVIIEPKDNDGFHLVLIPDFEGMTQGTDLADALYMAQDYINFAIIDLEDDNKTIPAPTPVQNISSTEGSIVTLVPIDTIAYRKENSSTPVKKTLTIPTWLNTKAEKNGINFSKTLQDALIEQLYT